ncbi:uncharacterized protein BJ171DRAFT_120661 [Polychytrium aggregatum]|uniref:uncharacterized protein n=1 Tax=Polychytrium aggregatum TaxID=110093 RepID=UPI0022FE6981|nr:uncharacterized protein BJ171DRAFT_120661 [Polychytrium aggregatum]KAI9204198.1 hypothetical protein BJ171DRAFT_120661 [Polychytrium aggregatum]
MTESKCHIAILIADARSESQPKAQRENCLLVINELLINQPECFTGHKKQLFTQLLVCRKDESDEVSGSADLAMETLSKMMERGECMSAYLEALEEWAPSINSEGPDGSPNGSCLQFLGPLLRQYTAKELSEKGFTGRIAISAIKGLNVPGSQNSLIRKSSIICLVELERLIGNSLWSYTQDLTDAQRKLLSVYIERERVMPV